MSGPAANEAWTALLRTLRQSAGNPHRRSARAILAAAEMLSRTEPWASMFPVLRGSDLQLAPLPPEAWPRGMPMVPVRYVVSADRFRVAFQQRLGPMVVLYACREEELPDVLAHGWPRLLKFIS